MAALLLLCVVSNALICTIYSVKPPCRHKIERQAALYTLRYKGDQMPLCSLRTSKWNVKQLYVPYIVPDAVLYIRYSSISMNFREFCTRFQRCPGTFAAEVRQPAAGHARDAGICSLKRYCIHVIESEPPLYSLYRMLSGLI